MRSSTEKLAEAESYPKVDRGFYHLTSHGWVRKDDRPFPAERLETWAYEAECPADDAKEQVCLIRTWICTSTPELNRKALHALYGQPVLPQVNRNVKFECEV